LVLYAARRVLAVIGITSRKKVAKLSKPGSAGVSNPEFVS